jgi:LysM repeat protein
MAGINQVLKMSWEIATKGQSSDTSSSNSNSNSDSDRILSSTIDDRTRLQALALANDCYKYKMDLVTNGVVITEAIKFVQHKKEELSKINPNERGEEINSLDSETTGPKNKIF